MSILRTAILGYGRNGGTMHAGGVENSDRFAMTAACDIDPERRKQAAERFGCPVYENYHEMLEKEELDLVTVVTRSDQHCQMACDCLEAGVNVLVTKPWAVNVGEAERMMETARRTGKTLLPWLPSRWGSVYKRLHEIVSQGAIGNVFMVRRAQTSFNTRSDWQTEKKYGGGYLLNWGPHIVDQGILIADSPVKTVYGRMKQTINPGDAEDVFLAVVQLESGTVVTAEYTVAVDDFPTWVLQGDRGTITVRGTHMHMSRQTPARPDDPTRYASMKAGEAEVTEEDIAGDQYGNTDEVYADIAAALLDGKMMDFPAPPEDAMALSKVFDAIRASAEQDTVIQF